MVCLLEEKRTEKELSLTELALKIGVSKSYLSKMEKHPSACNPTVNVIFRLSKELGISSYRILHYFKQHYNFDNEEDQDN
ncbi:helix-turn-helix domain-containing protein [Clostridium beijerinckii]|uniref:helix-turn-helix domain-containing protein n=1 Tax=Clostridium beijerinckii TaxID=1520 RepID=UPI001F1FD38D|nr:helix-turn-helix transcriptional regulator [Clostridium beijerinckii]